jgi:hypothetical protein
MTNLVLIEENKDGYAYLITKPSDIEEIINMMNVRENVLGYSYKILKLDDAKKHKKLVGDTYLETF